MLTRDLTRHWDAATARLRHARVIGLFLDFDGTLSRICLKPNEALMDSGIRRTLAVLANSSRFRVWIVSGRRLHDVSERGRVPNVRYLGVHGWEGRGSRSLSHLTQHALRSIADSLRGLENPESKLWIEDKQYSLSIHHRGVHHMERTAAHTLIGRALEPLTAHLRMLPGHEVWEILPHEIKDKGAAVRHRIALLGDPSAAIYIGDDVMDETAFRAMPQGLTIRVGRPSPSHAQYRLADVRQVAWFLDKLKNEFVNRKGASPKASSSHKHTSGFRTSGP